MIYRGGQDPYHLTAGALECGEMHAFQEPMLSLDAPMRENCAASLPFFFSLVGLVSKPQRIAAQIVRTLNFTRATACAVAAPTVCCACRP